MIVEKILGKLKSAQRANRSCLSAKSYFFPSVMVFLFLGTTISITNARSQLYPNYKKAYQELPFPSDSQPLSLSLAPSRRQNTVEIFLYSALFVRTSGDLYYHHQQTVSPFGNHFSGSTETSPLFALAAEINTYSYGALIALGAEAEWFPHQKLVFFPTSSETPERSPAPSHGSGLTELRLHQQYSLYFKAGFLFQHSFSLGIRLGLSVVKMDFASQAPLSIEGIEAAQYSARFLWGKNIGLFGRIALTQKIDLELEYIYHIYPLTSLFRRENQQTFSLTAPVDLKTSTHQIRLGIGIKF